MPGINEQVNLTLSRVDAIKMSGDVSKHNYLRAVGVAERLQEKLKQSGIEVSLDESIIALPDFYSRFHDDILIYLSSYICEFLNNIRWAIHTYLRPEFNKSFYYADDECLEYKFRTPDQIKSKYAINCYWELMNNMRRLPCMRKFIVSDSLKTEY